MAYPIKLWAKIKTEYETGNFSIADLAKNHTIPFATVKARSVKDNWQKGAVAPSIEKSIREKMIEQFAKRGMDEKVIATIDEMLSATKPTIVKGFGEEKESLGKNGEPQGFVAEVEDWQARDKAVTQYSKITGAYAAEKTETKTEIHGDIVVKYEFEDVKNVSDPKPA